MTFQIQPSFSKGEIAPALYGRVDTAAYQIALATAKNIIIHPYGGASNRPGLEWVGPCKTHNDIATRLIGFQFKTDDSYIIEVGNQYMRFIRNDAHVTDTPLAITAITQANPAVVTVTAHGYSNGDEVFIDGVFGMTQVNNKRFIVAGVTANTFQLTDQVTGGNVDSSSYGAYSSGGTSARIYTLSTPYLSADLQTLQFVQSADVMTITHNNYPPKELSRIAHNNWTLSDIITGPSINRPRSITITVGTTGAVTYKYAITAVTADSDESLQGVNNTLRTITGITQANPAVVTANAHGFSNGDEIYIDNVVGMTQVNDKAFVISGVTANTFALNVDSTAYTAYTSGGTAAQDFIRITNGAAAANNTLSWTAGSTSSRYPNAPVKYNVYKFDSGSFGIIGTTTATTFLDNNILADLSQSPPNQKNPFNSPNDYPACCSFYQQRRVFGSTINDPDTSFYSQTGNYSNFNTSSPLQDTDAIEATLASRQVNKIRNFIPGNDLLVLTTGSEWKVNSGPDNAFGPTTIQQKPQSEWGSSFIPPIKTGNIALFVTDDRAHVRTLGYSFQLDGYTGTEVTIFAPHIFENSTIEDWAFASSPDRRAYVILADGTGATLTFDDEQQVTAWTRWETTGWFQSVASIKNPETSATDQDGVYFIVERIINGNIVRYIEKLHSRKFTNVKDCFFVDCGATYDVPLTISNISLANPVVITSIAHGLSNGDLVDIDDITWLPNYDSVYNLVDPDQLNGYRYKVANVTTDTFELTSADDGSNIDGTAFNRYVGGGTVRKAITTIFGLEFLEGSDVAILADGNNVTGKSVSGGTVVLDDPASRVHIGLTYVADFMTLNIEAPGQGTKQGIMKRIPSVTIRLDKTRGLWVGPSFTQLAEMKQREFENMGTPTQLFTGDKHQELYPQWNVNGRLAIRQFYPLPMTILAVIPDVEYGDS